LKKIKNHKFVLVPEWEDHEATVLVFPSESNDFPEYKNSLKELQNFYCLWSKHILEQQKYLILCYKNPLDLEFFKSRAKAIGLDSKRIIFKNFVFNEIWCRDYLALSCRKKVEKKQEKFKYFDFKFDYWGKKYSYSDNSEEKLSELIFSEQELEKHNLILEGGAISFNGKDSLLASKESIIKRNIKNFSQEQIESKLGELLGIKKIIWIENVKLIGDDTDSHIDNLARFVKEDTIVYLKADSQENPNYSDLLRLESQLKNKTAFNLIPIESCSSRKLKNLPASYINFVFLNQAILVPGYQDQIQDQKASKIMQSIFPEKKIVLLDCSKLILGRGALHCASMQIPKISSLSLSIKQSLNYLH